MRKCVICGCDIEYGINGCMLMNECFKCHGGFPKYPKPTAKPFGWNLSDSELDDLEGRCIDDGE